MHTFSLQHLLGFDTSLEAWVEHTLLIVLVALIIQFAIKFFFSKANKIAEKTTSLWDDAVLNAVNAPLTTLIWLLAAIFILLKINSEFTLNMADELYIARQLVIIACFTWFAIKIIYNFSRNFIVLEAQNKIDLDQTTIDALSKLARLVVIVFAILISVQTLGFSISALLTAGGIGGIAIGFAAKDLLANFFGGLTIYLDRPFNVGDWVRSPDKAIEGTVEYISWRHTRIRGFNKNPIYVPNALFTQIVVENPSRMTNRRIKTTVGIRYDDIGAMKPIVEDIRNMLKTHDAIDTTQTIIVNFNDFNASSVDIFIYAYTKTVNWVKFHGVKEDLYLKIANIVAAHNAEMAFPTQTLHIDGELTPPDNN